MAPSAGSSFLILKSQGFSFLVFFCQGFSFSKRKALLRVLADTRYLYLRFAWKLRPIEVGRAYFVQLNPPPKHINHLPDKLDSAYLASSLAR